METREAMEMMEVTAKMVMLVMMGWLCASP